MKRREFIKGTTGAVAATALIKHADSEPEVEIVAELSRDEDYLIESIYATAVPHPVGYQVIHKDYK